MASTDILGSLYEQASAPSSGLANLPDDYDLGALAFTPARGASADVAGRLLGGLENGGHHAGVLTQTGRPRIFVASSRVGAAWLLRELLPRDVEIDWAVIADAASAADAIAVQDDGEEEGSNGGGSGGEQEGRGGRGGEETAVPETQQQPGADEMCTQEAADRDAFLNGQRDLARLGKALATGNMSVGNNNSKAEARRKRKREAEEAQQKRKREAKQALSEELVVDSGTDDAGDGEGDGDGGGSGLPPRPASHASAAEVQAWKSILRRPRHERELVISIKEGHGSGSGTMEPASTEDDIVPQRRQRTRRAHPTKTELTYFDLERWLVRAKSIGSIKGQKTLDDVTEALGRQEASGNDDGPDPAPGQQLREERQRQLGPQAMPPPGDPRAPYDRRESTAPPPSNQQQQDQQLVIHRPATAADECVARLVAALGRLEGTKHRLAWTVVEERLQKALFARDYNQTIELIVAERAVPGSGSLPSGPAGHARTRARSVLREKLADRPGLDSQLNKHVIGARRWLVLFERLGYGVVFLMSADEVPNHFVERDLTNPRFEQWLSLVEAVNGTALAEAKVVWDRIGGPAALESGNLAFSASGFHAVRNAMALVSTGKSAMAASQGTVVGEVVDTDDDMEDVMV